MNTRGDVLAALRDALDTERTLLNDTYRHLDRPATLMGLTIIQWAVCVITLALWWALTTLLPFDTQIAMSISGTLLGVPATVLLFGLTEGEFNIAAIARSVIRWRRHRGVLLPGAPERQPAGYELVDDVSVRSSRTLVSHVALEIDQLWSSSERATSARGAAPSRTSTADGDQTGQQVSPV